MTSFFRRRRRKPTPPPASPRLPPPASPVLPPPTPPPRRPPSGRVEEIAADPASFPPQPPPSPSPQPVPEPAPDLDELAAPAPPPPPVRLAGQFPTAAAALNFAGQLDGSGQAHDLSFGRSSGSTGWWVAAEAPLAATREQITAARGQTFVEVAGALVRDRGWGDTPPDAPTQPAPDIHGVGVVTLVRIAGLSRAELPVPPELAVLVPTTRVRWVIQRALDLRLTVGYRPVSLQPLFTTDTDRAAAETVLFEVRLRAETTAPPPSFLAALEHEPSLLPCRPVGERLLVQHPLASPLPDGQLARLAESDPLGGTWVLAGPGRRCARLVSHGELRNGAALVRLDDTYQLVDLDPGPPEQADGPIEPSAPPLRLTRSRTRGVEVDAILLYDADLACLPALLEGQPLADIALLVRGRDRHLLLTPPTRGDRHLLLAPGGLLERLPIGEPLYCLGPGLLYLPMGYRTQPLLPPSARSALFPTDANTAIVLQPDVALAFSLQGRQPVWTLWAGEAPPLDPQLPPSAHHTLAEVDRLVAPPTTPATTTPTRRPDLTERLHARSPAPARSWWIEALELEAAGDLAGAARLHEQHNELLRAAHLYERAARESSAGGPVA